MLFTICIPSYNRANTVLRTIESLESQTFKDFEILLIDDGSTDNTRRLVEGLHSDKLTYIFKENGGKHTALNVALDNAKGELFLVLDSDDQFFPDTLKKMATVWEQHKKEDKCCGIIGRCEANEKLIGKPFDSTLSEITYIEFHYGKNGGKYGDCCECIKTNIINKYRWPEDNNTRFVPEAYVLDQIGLDYYLIATNEIYKNVEYLPDGITSSGKSHKEKNMVGYLYNYVSKLESVFPKTKKVTFEKRFVTWWKYWAFVSMDENSLGPRVKHVTLLGWFAKATMPILNHIKKG